MIFHAGQNAQLSLYTDASRMCIFYHFSRQIHVLVKWQGGTVDHNRGVAALDRRHTGIEITAVIQVQDDGNIRICPIFLYGVRDILCADLLVFQCRIHKVGTAAHKAVR